MVQNSPLYFTPPEDNEWLKQTSDAVKKQTQDELENISKSYGFAVMMGSRKVFMPFATYYQRYIDAAIMDVISGGFDYNSVIRRVVTQMVNSGLRTVDYASGHSSRVDVAVRRSILTGVFQITGKINERNASELDTEYFEVDWHPAARPDHQKWQGKVYSRDELRSVCGLGTVMGLCGANCRHTYYPFIPGVSERLYADEWLEEQNRKEAKTKEWQGKELNAYEQTQQQRKMETAMRAQREKVQLLKDAGADKDDIMIARAKYQAQLDEYGRYCKKMGLPEQRERIYQDMRGRVATNTRKENARYTPEMLENADKDSKLYKKYKEVLGKDAGSLADFRKMKYNNPEKWDEMQHRYSVVRLYEVNSGSMSPSKIFEMDQEAFRIKTTQFTGSAKRQGNIAVMELDGELKISNSGLSSKEQPAYANFKGDKSILVLKTKSPQFKTSFVGTHERDVDSEAKLFEYAAKVARDGKPHTLNLLSERCMCESCRGVMAQFKKAYPNVAVNAVSNSKEQSLKNKNKPWAGRAR